MNTKGHLIKSEPNVSVQELTAARRAAQTNGQFAMVYVEGQGAPSHFHYSEDTLTAEVERLARKYPGLKVFVLRPTEEAVVEQAPVIIKSINNE